MLEYIVTANRNLQVREALFFEGETQTVQYDFTPWLEGKGYLTSVVWTVKSGQASISGEVLDSGVVINSSGTTNFNFVGSIVDYTEDLSAVQTGVPFTVVGSDSNDGTYTSNILSSDSIVISGNFVTEASQSILILQNAPDNVTASAKITTASSGSSMIKITATTSTGEVFVTHLRILSKDPDVITEDYGLIH